MIIKLFDEYQNVDDIKEIIINKAVKVFASIIEKDENEAKKLLDFFINKGYNIDDELENVYSPKAFKYFLENGVDPNKYKKNYYFLRNIENLNIQKVLIDFGYESLIYDTVGFNEQLNDEDDPKYSRIIDRYNKANKYNI